MSYSPSLQRVILNGGNSIGTVLYGDTFSWDGVTWASVTSQENPLPRVFHAMTHMSNTGQVVLFGGAYTIGGTLLLSDTWTFDSNGWLDRTPPDPLNSPPPRIDHAMAYDEEHGRVLLFGGTSTTGQKADTWSWDGTQWTQLNPSTVPLARSGHAMAYDAQAREIVLFGGIGGGSWLDDTWVWNGTNWIEKTPQTKPSARNNHQMAYEPQLGKVMLFGGHVGFVGDINDTWVWNGSNWEELASADKPAANQNHAMATDYTRRQIVLFGGSDLLGFAHETWIWDSGIQPGVSGSIFVISNRSDAKFKIEGPITDGSPPLVREGSGRSEKFSDLPAGRYRITFDPVVDSVAPLVQEETLSAGRSITFMGHYRKVFGVGFTGFDNEPKGGGVRYPSGYTADSLGVVNLLNALGNTAQYPEFSGVRFQVFTYYAEDLPFVEDKYLPAPKGDHLDAQNWLTSQYSVGDRVLVVGHSYGGHRAALFINQPHNVTIDALITIDPIDWDDCNVGLGTGKTCNQSSDAYAKANPLNIADSPVALTQVLGLRQSTGPDLPLKGYHFKDRGKEQLPYTILKYVHQAIDDSPEVTQEVRNKLIEVIHRPAYGRELKMTKVKATPASTSVFVTWDTNELSTSVVEYGPDQAYREIAFSQDLVREHRLGVSNLLPSTTYHFKLYSITREGKVGTIADGTFSTAP
jgi:hypothetical protein